MPIVIGPITSFEDVQRVLEQIKREIEAIQKAVAAITPPGP